MKKKTGDVKSVEAKQQTSTTKAAEEKTYASLRHLWQPVEFVIAASTTTQRGRKKTAT